MQRIRPLLIALAFVAGSGLCPSACVRDEGAASVDGADVGDSDPRWTISVGGTVRYSLAWDWETVERTDHGWRFETDLRYQVHLTEAWVNSYSIELLPCDDQAMVPPSWWIGAAYADHSYEGDSSRVEGPYLETFGDPLRAIGFGAASGWAYCKLAYLIAPTEAEGDTQAIDAVWLKGSYTPPGGEETPFEASVALAGGASVQLPPAPADVPLGVHYIVTRYPARAFDGLRLEELVATEIAWEVLANLSEMTVVTAETIEPSGS